MHHSKMLLYLKKFLWQLRKAISMDMVESLCMTVKCACERIADCCLGDSVSVCKDSVSKPCSDMGAVECAVKPRQTDLRYLPAKNEGIKQDGNVVGGKDVDRQVTNSDHCSRDIDESEHGSCDAVRKYVLGLYCTSVPIDRSNVLAKFESSPMQCDMIVETLQCIFQHRFVQGWLFEEGFMCLCGTLKGELVSLFCEACVHLSECFSRVQFRLGTVLNIPDLCQQMVAAVFRLECDAETSLLRVCLVTLMTVDGESSGLETLLAIVRLPVSFFVLENTTEFSCLAEALFLLVRSLAISDAQWVEASSGTGFRASVKGLFSLVVAGLDVGLANALLSCLRAVPEAAAECCQETLHALLDVVLSKSSAVLLNVVELVLTHCAVSHAHFAVWLSMRKKEMKKRTLCFAPLLLVYVCQTVIGKKGMVACFMLSYSVCLFCNVNCIAF